MQAAADRYRPASRVSVLGCRSKVLEAIRSFFVGRGFLEVETPSIVEAPGQEAHLEPLRLADRCGWLITSPEHHMKRLLAGGGLARVFQICRCYRGDERSSQHRPEFTMVEWYRTEATYDHIARDVESLVAHVATTLHGSTVVATETGSVDLTPPWPRLAVAAAFESFAGIPAACLLAGETDTLRQAAQRTGLMGVDARDDWESLFGKLLVQRVEPALARLRRGVHLRDYPVALAALARLKAGGGGVAERFESYAGGLELANGFGELTDPREQRRRFGAERLRRHRAGGDTLPLDEPFLRDLSWMPSTSGVALGVDRLIMLITGAHHIDEVMAF